MTKKSMRDEMPCIAAWVDDLRAAFGKEVIDAQIRKALDGEQTFWASEGGYEIGTRLYRRQTKRKGALDE